GAKTRVMATITRSGASISIACCSRPSGTECGGASTHKQRTTTMGTLSFRAGLIASLLGASLIASAQVPAPQTGAPPAAAPNAAPPSGPPRAPAPLDPRVQQRTYTFMDTNEVLPYAVFVSSKVAKNKKNPLIISLHGLGGDQNTMMRFGAVQAAEDGGYILVTPMGYNSSGWYGAPASMAAGTGGANGGVGMGGPPRGGPGGPP